MTGKTQRYSLEQLISQDYSAWTSLQERIQRAKHSVEVLPPSDPQRSNALLATQLGTNTPIGAIVYETGGLLIDDGWIRILGSGSERMQRSLPDWNAAVGNSLDDKVPPYWLVGDDVLGGRFVLDNGALKSPGTVFYYAPDTLQWGTMQVGYGDFLTWCFEGDLAKFYGPWRWAKWREDVSKLSGDECTFVYPPLSVYGAPIESRYRKVVSVGEMYSGMQ